MGIPTLLAMCHAPVLRAFPSLRAVASPEHFPCYQDSWSSRGEGTFSFRKLR